MDQEIDPVAASVSPPRSYAWIGKAAFEAVLIVFGLVGALLVDEWRDSRERAERVRTALDSIRAELLVNDKALEGAIQNHRNVMAALTEAIETNTTYQKGIIVDQPFSSVAWDAVLNTAITNDVDHTLLMSLGGAYRALDLYLEQRTVFLNHLYTSQTDARQNPLGLRGWLNDLQGRARGVRERVRAASSALGQPLPPAEKPAAAPPSTD